MEKKEVHFVRNPNYIFRKVVDEFIFVTFHQDVTDLICINTLNGVGAFLWGRLDQPRTQADLQAAVLDEYAVDPQAQMADLERFLGDMTSIGALRKV